MAQHPYWTKTYSKIMGLTTKRIDIYGPTPPLTKNGTNTYSKNVINQKGNTRLTLIPKNRVGRICGARAPRCVDARSNPLIVGVGMDRLAAMDAFVRVVDAGSFSGAAK